MRSPRPSGKPADRPAEKPGLFERVGRWWNNASLQASFRVYITVYLLVALVGSLCSAAVFSTLQERAARGAYEFDGTYLFDPATERLCQVREIVVASPETGTAYPLFVQSARTEQPFVALSELPAYVQISYIAETFGAVDALPDGADGLVVANGEADMAVTVEQIGDGYVVTFDGPLDTGNLAAFDALQRSIAARSAAADLAGLSDTASAKGLLVSPVGYFLFDPPASTALVNALGVAQVLMFPLWFGACIWFASRRFFSQRVEPALTKLRVASDLIAGQDLDFTATYPRDDEMGALVRSFETMRASLAQSQRTLWRTAEERKHLNAAFAHDLRTPLTVLRGRLELLQARVQTGNIDPARLEGDCATLLAQVERLEGYVAAMAGISRLEDRPVEPADVPFPDLAREIQTAGSALCEKAGVAFALDAPACTPAPGASGPAASPAPDPRAGDRPLHVDRAAVAEVAENLVANAARHAAARVQVSLHVDEAPSSATGSAPQPQAQSPARTLVLEVLDDGPGFSPEALRRGCEPFFCENKGSGGFGLGLNIARMLCQKHGGSLDLANGIGDGRGLPGARVTARFAV